MRKLISGLFISLDGVVESPDQWQFDVFDADFGQAMVEHLAAEDTVLMGRVTYQEWAPYWPTSKDEPYASHINSVPKFVVSDSLSRADWNNSRLVRGAELAQVVAQLKARPGGNIGVTGSPTLVRSLLRQNMLDELTLMIHPVVAGRGKKLFEEGAQLQRMKLAQCKTTASGVVFATYHPA